AVDDSNAALSTARRERPAHGVQVHTVLGARFVRADRPLSDAARSSRSRHMQRLNSLSCALKFFGAGAVALCGLAVASAVGAQTGSHAASFAPPGWKMPRLADGKPDLHGIWTNKSVTPFERPVELGEKEFFTPEEAKAFVEAALARS